MRFVRLSDLAPQSLAWLWPGRLALGKLALLDGDPGLGKSLLTLDLCARLTTGRPFPDGLPGPGAADVIVLCAEDAYQDTVQPRLQRLQADIGHAHCPQPEAHDLDGPIGFPSRVGFLEDAVARTGARLVVIDPVHAFLDRDVSINSDPSVRRALAPLAALADRFGCAVLFVRHLNKYQDSRALYRGGGSIAFQAACRSTWLVGPDPREPGRCVLAQVKNNLAARQPSLAYTLPHPDSGAPPIVWQGTSDLTADQLLRARPAEALAARPRAKAREALADFLQDGPRTSIEVWDFAGAHGLAERTVMRAKQDLAIQSIRVTLQGQTLTYWLLPGQTLPREVPTSAIDCDPDELLRNIPGPEPAEAP